jgi:hypothetical protein
MTRFLCSFWQLQVSWYGTPSLTRGWVCNLLTQLLLGLARAIALGSKSRRTQTIFYCLIWDSPNLEGQVSVFISPGTGWPSYTPGHWVPFCRLFRLAGTTVEVISPRNRVAQLYPLALSSLLSHLTTRRDYGGGIAREAQHQQ